jgi:hypothetical protein
MEIVDPAEQAKHRHTWLQWLGLQEPPPEPESWVAVARGFTLDSPGSDSSRLAAQLVAAIGQAGIEAHQRSYEFYDAVLGVAAYIPRSGTVTSVAVMVHERDLSQAVKIACSMKNELSREADEPESGALSDAELTRQALDAGPPPPD